jgi:hypothetical protein
MNLNFSIFQNFTFFRFFVSLSPFFKLINFDPRELSLNPFFIKLIKTPKTPLLKKLPKPHIFQNRRSITPLSNSHLARIMQNPKSNNTKIIVFEGFFRKLFFLD